jgi:diacylglycerol kinase (ATP)
VGILVRRALLVVNPASRRGGRYADIALAQFHAAGVECSAIMTRKPGEGAAIASEQAGGYDAVFTLGGDGTAMEVVGALSGRGTPVGILPGGTGNLIARTLGTPLSVRNAVPALLQGTVVDVDLGRLGDGRRFAFAAGVGIDATMIERTPARLKRRLGVAAYALTASRAVLARDSFAVRLTVDGTVYERRASAVMVANFGAVLNELITLGPGIAHDDGKLDACVFTAESTADAMRVMWKLWRRDFRPDPRLLYVPGREITVETDPPRAAQADGDLIGQTPISITVEPHAARLIKARLE